MDKNIEAICESTNEIYNVNLTQLQKQMRNHGLSPPISLASARNNTLLSSVKPSEKLA